MKTFLRTYNIHKNHTFSILLLLCFCIGCSKNKNTSSTATDYPIIPTPQNIIYGKIERFFNTVSISKDQFENEAFLLENFLIDKGIKVEENGVKIIFRKAKIKENYSEEAYKLQIDSTITIIASSSKGAFYAVQTLKQLFRKKENQGVFPEIQITDWPSFKIRGFMHDTGRNFQSVNQLKEQIEVLSQYKYNVFHWHLTDNPGWRLESKKYPELQSEEATSRGKGKFYSQDDFKNILAFCKERHITVIPEFDIPGHTAAFRKSFAITSMKDDRVQAILLDLFDELMSLADADEMPFIHIGTDEVRNKEEYMDKNVILSVMNLIKERNREVIVWKEGIAIKEDSTSINQLWALHEGREGHRFIDSRANYINHLDPFAGMARLFYQQPCRQAVGDNFALGGILCAWPDNNVQNERDLLRQNPIYPSIVFYSDAIWKGRQNDKKEYWAKLPSPQTVDFEDFKKFEEKVIVHRNEFFQGKEFPYVEQTNIIWNLIGPFDHQGDLSKSFPIEDSIKEKYTVDQQEFIWSGPHAGGTIHLNHFFGFISITNEKTGTYYAYTNIYSPDNRDQDFWIGFQGWSRSGGRRGGPTPKIGQWHTTNPKIWVNDQAILPPIWQQPNLGVKTDEIPFIDEDYFYRKPTKISLKKGWNKVLLKIPQGDTSWKWMFTCVPVDINSTDIREVKNLKYNINPI